MARESKEEKETDNPSVYNKIRRRELSCPICPPHKVENHGRWVKHGKQKPKYKDHSR